jgi:starvation-inducible DNA-binding protein
MSLSEVKARRKAPLETPTDLSPEATKEIAAALTILLADFFAVYLKTKNFHWHVSGPHFRDYHLLFDEQGEQIFAATDAIAERVRKTGGTTLRSTGQIARACSASWTTTQAMSRRATCSPSCAKTTSN